MLFFHDEKRQNEPRTNEERVQLIFWGIYFWGYKLVSGRPELLLFKRNKTVENNPLKLIVWDIPSTKQEKHETFSRPKCSLLNHINKLKTNKQTKNRQQRVLRETYLWTGIANQQAEMINNTRNDGGPNCFW